MKHIASGQKLLMAQWSPFPWCTKKTDSKKMVVIHCCFMHMALMAPIPILFSTVVLSVCWTGDLFMQLHIYVADRSWAENGLKMEDCYTRKIHLLILWIAHSFLLMKNILPKKNYLPMAEVQVVC